MAIVTRRRLACFSAAVLILLVQIVGLAVDFWVMLLTNPLTDGPQLPAQRLFELHPLLVIASWIVLAIGWPERWVWVVSLVIGLITPVAAITLGVL